MPRSDAYIIGHGGWSPGDGFSQVPAGCKIFFYTEFGKTLSGHESDDLIEGTFNRGASRTVDEFKMAPNMKYFPMSDDDIEDAHDLLRDGDSLIYTAQTAGKDLAG
ncbi:MAG: putative adhesin [Bryobacteraceae bacterium]